MPNDFGFTLTTFVLIAASVALAYRRLCQARYPRRRSVRKQQVLTGLVVLANLAMIIATISHDQATYPHTLLSIFGTAVRVGALALVTAAVAWAQQTKRYYC